MMTYPAPSHSDQSLTPAPSTPPSQRNSAAITSLVCAILWPLILMAVLLWNSRSCTTTDTGASICTGTATPAWFSTLTGLFLLILPPAGIISGVLGLVRSFRRPQIHGRWPAVIGLCFGLLWLVATQFL